MSLEKFGLWVDDPARVVLADGYIQSCKDMGVSEFAVMIDDAPKRWKPSWSFKQWDNLCELAQEHGIDLSITTWPYPDRRAIDHMYFNQKDGIEAFMSLASDAGVLTGEESDTEWNWKAGKVKNFISKKSHGLSRFDVAGRYLSDVKNRLAAKYGHDSESTVFPGHTEMTEHADVSIFMMMVFLQIYSVASRGSKGNKRKILWDHRYGPGNMQTMGINKAIVAGIEPNKLAAGLALWNQQWPGHTIREAFKTALYTCTDHGITHVRGWSSKWVVGIRKRERMAKVLREVIPARLATE